MGETEIVSGRSFDSSDFEQSRQRNIRCGDFCSFNILKIPGLILRNLVFPREMWDDFPDGLDRIADYFLYQPDYGNARKNIPTPDLSKFKCTHEDVTILTKDNVKLHAYLIKHLDSEATTSDTNDSKLDVNYNKCPQAAPPPVLPSPPSSPPLIIYFHGNAGNIGFCVDIVKIYKANPDLAICNWLLVEYRGYGKSQGKQSEKGLYSDAKAAFQYAESRKDLNTSKKILYGHSMGGGVAIHIAAHPRYRKKVGGLILENTFTSVPLLAKKVMGISVVNYMPNCCYSSKFESINKITKVKCPTLFLCGMDDEVVPSSMTEILYEKCGSSTKVMEKFEDGQHNDTYMCDNYLPKVADFVRTKVMCTSVVGNSQPQTKPEENSHCAPELDEIPLFD